MLKLTLCLFPLLLLLPSLHSFGIGTSFGVDPGTPEPTNNNTSNGTSDGNKGGEPVKIQSGLTFGRRAMKRQESSTAESAEPMEEEPMEEPKARVEIGSSIHAGRRADKVEEPEMGDEVQLDDEPEPA